MKPAEGRKRVVIEDIQPQVDCGRTPARRFLGDSVQVSAAIFCDGHDHVLARLLSKHQDDPAWLSTPMTALPNDLWAASFKVDRLGPWSFTIQAWVDHFDTWCADLKKRLAAQPLLIQPDPASPDPAQRDLPPQDIPLALTIGAALFDQIASRAGASSKGSKAADAKQLKSIAASLRRLAGKNSALYQYPLTPQDEALAARYPDLSLASVAEKELRLWVDRERARFSSWYELFPRSTAPAATHDQPAAREDQPDPTRHGTFADVELLLPEIAAMGFDILYLPPIHPIGHAFRKGPNNSTTPGPDAEGSPWAIGSSEGGHKSIHPALGTFAGFDRLLAATHASGMELALDIAFQCSPDHPWVTQHPDWFIHRPDGTIQYAENPPKKYQDIYPLNFESPDWLALWDELRSVFQFWIDRGVRVFRVDNPHTKALDFWQWCIDDLHRDSPDAIFLAEAFTRPHIMYALAKRGFTQSYTYFTWRTEKSEIEAYFKEITKPPISDFFTPNLWPNTPDILHASLQTGGLPAFQQRLILATTLAASYGIYGPAFELCENLPIKPGSEEYLHSEKYEIRLWDRRDPDSLAPLITLLNQIRRTNPALQSDLSLHFHPVDNSQILCYSKSTLKPPPPLTLAETLSPVPQPAARPAAASGPSFVAPAPATPPNTILVVVNLDPHYEQSGWIDLDLKQLGIRHDETFDVEDLLTGIHYQWHDRSNFVVLSPAATAHIFRLTRKPQ
jgi:starch synthase (maltosyl-transferring)